MNLIFNFDPKKRFFDHSFLIFVITLIGGWISLLPHPLHIQAEADPQILYQKAHESIKSIVSKELQSVEMNYQSRHQFQKYIQKNLDRLFSPEEIERLQSIYFHLGLIPEEYSFRNNLADLYKDQAGAYYNPKTKTINVIQGNVPREALYFIFIHELVHAYQDQHYDLKSLQNKYQNKGSIDKKLTLSFLLEGHANLVSILALLPDSSLDNQFFRNPTYGTVFDMMAQISETNLSELTSFGKFLGSSYGSAMNQNIKKLENTPQFLVQMMLDPYLLGQKIWFSRSARLGWNRTQRWLSSPPRNTKQFLYSKSSPEESSLKPSESNKKGLGVYILLRWLGNLQNRPDWGKAIQNDSNRLISTQEGTFLRWKIKFQSATSANQFLQYLSEKTKQSLLPGKTIPVQFDSMRGKRFLTLCVEDRQIKLLLDDKKPSDNSNQCKIRA